ncbi:LytTR family DNA-binding domain-containing protein [Aquabacterium sp.]|uniref:LytR/AlgR family response regulator transcription factor n=1 Tax=Aquabacterium sp. TaxID=1872578 RepID=UPI002E36E87A|nr:LytTR family DNA-binding domain-containing protein [Aquabacterium sp.]HEX5311391.1 LytTR family DNA-binding domain-containing protein [Aquabacterium sp.]
MSVCRVVIVDDEPLARLRMRSLLAQCHCRCDVVGEFGDADSTLQAFKGWRQVGGMPDVVFLDIAMPGRDGLQLARALRAEGRAPAFVFVTAHPEHAVAAFEIEALDYLTKPIRLERLEASLQRWHQRQPAADAAAGDEPDEALRVVERGAWVRVPFRDLVYCKAEQKHVTVRTAAQAWQLDVSLNDLEQRLGPRFVRVHRNALVARDAMTRLGRREDPETGQEGWAIWLDATQEWLAVSRRQVALVKEKMAGRV